MKRFNPERELYKIKYGKRDKVIFTMIFGIILLTIGYSFALYQVRHSKRIIYTTVDDFRNNKDIILAVYYDGEKKDDFPKKGDNYVFDHIDCDNKDEDYTVASWNYNVWGLSVLTKGPNKCDVYFRKLDKYQDTSGANPPELYQGLIPVYYGDNGEVYVANLEQEWYDYDKHNWANAVLVSNDSYSKYVIDGEYQSNTEIPMSEILQMYVWIPRYKYQLFNAVNGESKPEQEIQIEFESGTLSTGEVSCEISSVGVETCENAENGKWYTHPAFTFGDTQLKGIWVGKFETNGTLTDIKILPNINTLNTTYITDMFNAARKMEGQNASKYNLNQNEIDTHMMKNMEWGAMAYLAQSKYGRCNGAGVCTKIEMNTRSDFLTGYSGSIYTWETVNGQLASTTGNIYGIYDTRGGRDDLVMGNVVNKEGQFNPSSGNNTFYVDEQNQSSSKPSSKYYDIYEYGTSLTDHRRGHFGDSTREILKIFGNLFGGWYGSLSYFPAETRPWFRRGGYVQPDSSYQEIFMFDCGSGQTGNIYTFRVVLTAQDGAE